MPTRGSTMTGHQSISAGEKSVACPYSGLLSCNRKGCAIFLKTLMRDALNNITLKYPVVFPSLYLSTLSIYFSISPAYGKYARNLTKLGILAGSQSTDRRPETNSPTSRVCKVPDHPSFSIIFSDIGWPHSGNIQHEGLGIQFPTPTYSIRLLSLRRSRTDTFVSWSGERESWQKIARQVLAHYR